MCTEPPNNKAIQKGDSDCFSSPLLVALHRLCVYRILPVDPSRVAEISTEASMLTS